MPSSRFPYPIPTGWFQVAWSNELEPGGVKPLRYFDRDLVLFRTEAGQVHVLDAHCPHLGAHLGHGGRVEGDKVVCPFHAWGFDGTGACTSIPYANKVPRQAKVRAWPVVEQYGLIMVWHDLTGAGPSWELPPLPEYASDEWTDYHPLDWTIRTCNQEMAENSVDAAHFLYLHGTAEMPETSAHFDGHHFHAESTTAMTTPAGRVDGRVVVDEYGFGFTTSRFLGLVETLLISSATPIDHDHVHIRFSFTVKKFGGRSLTAGVGKAFVAEISRQLEQDIPIWENKVFLDRPVLCDGDGPIGLLRTWARQFYPPTAAAAK